MTTNLTSQRFYLLPFVFIIGFINLCAQVSFESAFPNLTFEFPVEIQGSNDGTNRIFVVEQPGQIKVFPNNSAASISDVQTFLDLRTVVEYSAGLEIGLLGLAFHPNYASNGFFYVYYIDRDARYQMRLARYQVSASNPNMADPASGTLIFSFDKNQTESNHNGGKIAFGPDGYLYISVGDGGGGGDPQGNGQNLNTAFGSILRIDVDLDGNNPVETNPELPNGNYEIPTSNPRFGQSGLDELYAWGIRNTWKFSFDSNTIWGGDVGQEDIEEINIIELGGNYGWNRFEGSTLEDGTTDLVTTPDIRPIFEYNHNNGDVSITGGYVYRGSITDPAIQGKYIYGDYVSGRVWALDYNFSTGAANNQFLFRTTGQFISSFGLDESGELYFSDYGSAAQIYRITSENTGPVTTPVNGVGAWANLGSGVNGIVETIAASSDGLYYVGGEFTNAGGVTVNNLAIYDGSNWNSFGTGTNGIVNAIAMAPNGNIYVGGSFSQIDGITASNIAVWNGTSWSPLGSGTNGPVAKIGVDSNNRVYVGGAFETAGGIQVNNIALWDNGNWNALTDIGNGISGTNNEIRAISFDEDNNLLIGGNFDSAGGNNAPRIAIWDGNNWSTFGEGTSGFVQAILVRPNYIYAGGNFSIAGSETVNRIARWNRNTLEWESLNNGLSGNVNALAHDGSYLYAGGSFETASDVANINEIMNNIARWSEGQGWEAMGTNTSVGVDIRINALEFSINSSELLAGGNFSSAGIIAASNIASWTSAQSLDDDGDGVSNDLDQCPNTPLGEIANSEGCSNSQLDDDGDGVANGADDCPNTPLGTIVDNNGCEISTIPQDNFTISSTSLSCIGANDGQIIVEAQLNLEYQGILSNSSLEDQVYNFGQSLNIVNLPAGIYDFCITQTDFPDYQSCSRIAVAEPEALTVDSFVDDLNKMVTLQMSGASSYQVMLNGMLYSTSENELQLPLSNKVNIIQVSTDNECQGTFQDTLILSDDVEIYPNPFEDFFFIRIKTLNSGNAKVNLYTMSGEKVFSREINYSNGQIEVPTGILKSGMYIISVQFDGQNQAFKLLKR